MTSPVSPPEHAVVLLSGGLDSTTALWWAKRSGFALHALSFNYGQRHLAELGAAAAVAHEAGVVDRRVASIDLRAWGGSALTSDVRVPRNRTLAAMSDGIPVTYVPGRNTIFLAFALSYAEAIGATTIVCGVNALDYSGYPDCRPEYIAAFNTLAALATREGVEGRPIQVAAPLIDKTKVEIIHLGTDLGAPLHLTHSCYDPVPVDVTLGGPNAAAYATGTGTAWAACGACDSCLLRAQGFADAKVPDPTRYVHGAPAVLTQ